MMRDQFRHFLAAVAVFLVSIGLMAATPKKSQADYTLVGRLVCTTFSPYPGVEVTTCTVVYDIVPALVCNNQSA